MHLTINPCSPPAKTEASMKFTHSLFLSTQNYRSFVCAKFCGSQSEIWGKADLQAWNATNSRPSPRPRQSMDSMHPGSFTSLTSTGTPRKPALEAVEVDGMPRQTVDAWFVEADTQHKGLLASKDAIAFFQRTGLSPKVLSKVHTPKPSMLTTWVRLGLQAPQLLSLAYGGNLSF